MMCKLTMGGIVAGVLFLTAGCHSSTPSKNNPDEASTSLKAYAVFNSDSAYSYVEDQVALGPRVPGSAAAQECASYISTELRRHGADSVRLQPGVVRAYNGDVLKINNVMGSFNPGANRRILLAAHYDTRPWADSDANEDFRTSPIPGANDGGSGVGVLLEIARQLGQRQPGIGVDMLFVDAEDYGQASGFSNHDESWCIGTQYWVQNLPYATDSLPAYAIVLDMVGGMDAKFHREYFSNQAAPEIVDRVWSTAAQSGYSDRFINKEGGIVIDDHYFIAKAGIPAIDIVESKNDQSKSFPTTWHTMADDMDHIDKSSLKAVGQTVLNLIYNEKLK